MAGVITINFKVIKGGMATLNMKSPIYVPGPVEPHFGPGRHIYFEGFSVDEHGRQHYMDVTVAYRQTILREHELPSSILLSRFFPCTTRCFSLNNHARKSTLNTNYPAHHLHTGCIEYLTQFGYSPYQIYLLLSCAPVQGHVAGIVDIPNACTTLGLPVDIFDFDITPEGVLAAAAATGGKGVKRDDMGSCAFESGVSTGKVIEPKERAKGSRDGDFSFGGGLTYKTASGSGASVTAAGTDAVAGTGSSGGSEDSGKKEVKEEHKGTAVANIMGGA